MIASSLPARGLLSCAASAQWARDARAAASPGRSQAEVVAALGVAARVREAGGPRSPVLERRRILGTPALGGSRRFGGFCRAHPGALPA